MRENPPFCCKPSKVLNSITSHMYFKALEMLSPVRTSLAAEMAFKSNKLVLKWENKAYWLQTEEQVET